MSIYMLVFYVFYAIIINISSIRILKTKLILSNVITFTPILPRKQYVTSTYHSSSIPLDHKKDTSYLNENKHKDIEEDSPDILYIPSLLSLSFTNHIDNIYDDEHFISLLCDNGYIIHYIDMIQALNKDVKSSSIMDDNLKTFSILNIIDEVIKWQLSTNKSKKKSLVMISNELSVLPMLQYIAQIALPRQSCSNLIKALFLIDPPPILQLQHQSIPITTSTMSDMSIQDILQQQHNILQRYIDPLVDPILLLQKFDKTMKSTPNSYSSIKKKNKKRMNDILLQSPISSSSVGFFSKCFTSIKERKLLKEINTWDEIARLIYYEDIASKGMIGSYLINIATYQQMNNNNKKNQQHQLASMIDNSNINNLANSSINMVTTISEPSLGSLGINISITNQQEIVPILSNKDISYTSIDINRLSSANKKSVLYNEILYDEASKEISNDSYKKKKSFNRNSLYNNKYSIYKSSNNPNTNGNTLEDDYAIQLDSFYRNILKNSSEDLELNMNNNNNQNITNNLFNNKNNNTKIMETSIINKDLYNSKMEQLLLFGSSLGIKSSLKSFEVAKNMLSNSINVINTQFIKYNENLIRNNLSFDNIDSYDISNNHDSYLNNQNLYDNNIKNDKDVISSLIDIPLALLLLSSNNQHHSNPLMNYSSIPMDNNENHNNQHQNQQEYSNKKKNKDNQRKESEEWGIVSMEELHQLYQLDPIINSNPIIQYNISYSTLLSSIQLFHSNLSTTIHDHNTGVGVTSNKISNREDLDDFIWSDYEIYRHQFIANSINSKIIALYN